MTPDQKTSAAAATEVTKRSPVSREVVLQEAANELVFAVVGHVGSGTSEIANALKGLLEANTLSKGKFDTTLLKARDGIVA